MKIKTKIILGATLGALLSVVGVSSLITLTASKTADKSYTELEKNALISIRNAKKEQVQNYFSIIRGQLSTYSNNKMIIEAMSQFDSAFDEIGQQLKPAEKSSETPNTLNSYIDLKGYYMGPFAEKFKQLNSGENANAEPYYNKLDERTLKLQDLYIAQNPNPLGEKDSLITATDGSRYSKLHSQYHPFIRSYLKQFGYYDIFLVNNDGDVVYSVFKELDYATNLETGSYAETGLGKAFKMSAADNIEPNTVNIVDFAPYYPSYNGAASFFSSPIYKGDKKLGVLIMQAPVDKLNNVMTSNNLWKNVGMGESGETYIVGNDNLLRNDSRFLIEDRANYIAALKTAGDPNVDEISAKDTSIGLQRADTIGTKDALLGNEGFNIFKDYRGISVLSAYTPLDLPGLDWVLMSEIDEAEAFKPLKEMNNNIIISASMIGLGALLLVGLGSFLLVRSLTRPLSQLKSTMSKVAEGDLTARAKLTSGDELEELANTFDSMLDERTSAMDAVLHNEQLNNSVVELMNATAQLADRDLTIEVPVAEDVTGTISDALNMMIEETSDVLIEINKVSKQVEDSVKLVQSQTNTVKGAADNEKIIIQDTIDQLNNVSQSIQNIGGLVQTISGLTQKVQESSTTTAYTVNKNIEGMGQIRETVGETEKRIKRLGERSQEIGNIVDIINTLSERTNVLALNASMQAASAGEAGKGFAVVAEEVQRLSESSRESTLEISALIDSIQLETSEAISTMAATIARVVEGTKLAGQAGSEMNKTQTDALELAEAIKRISAESESQTQANTALMTQANTVLDSTEKTSVALDEQSIQANNLVVYAEKLRTEVGSFKLPTQ